MDTKRGARSHDQRARCGGQRKATRATEVVRPLGGGSVGPLVGRPRDPPSDRLPDTTSGRAVLSREPGLLLLALRSGVLGGARGARRPGCPRDRGILSPGLWWRRGGARGPGWPWEVTAQGTATRHLSGQRKRGCAESRNPSELFDGGGIWESNPPTTLLTPHTGFEVRESHQCPRYLRCAL